MSVPTATATATATAERKPRRASGRRTYLRSDDRRAQILDIAKRVFVREGYHRANIADICVAAGIGRGTLYQYFGSKQLILVEILKQVATRVGAVVDARPPISVAAAYQPVSRAAAVAFCRHELRTILDAIFVDESTLRLVLRDARGLDLAADRIIATIDGHLLATMEAQVTDGQKLGMIRSGDARLIARYLLGGIEKIVVTALAAGERLDLDQVVALSVDLQLFGIWNQEAPR